MTKRKILLINGSLSHNSLHQIVLDEIATWFSEEVDFEFSIALDLPIYRPQYDIEDIAYLNVKQLRAQVKSADAIVIASPEYNWSMSSALKNALDWCSEPYFESIFKHKKVSFFCVSPSQAGGGARSLMHLRTVLASLLADILVHPDVVIGNCYSKLDLQNKKIQDENLVKYLKNYIFQLIK
jgi:chromate reductase, NAD(P)H dehydrogenase (quinone)